MLYHKTNNSNIRTSSNSDNNRVGVVGVIIIIMISKGIVTEEQ